MSNHYREEFSQKNENLYWNPIQMGPTGRNELWIGRVILLSFYQKALKLRRTQVNERAGNSQGRQRKVPQSRHKFKNWNIFGPDERINVQKYFVNLIYYLHLRKVARWEDVKTFLLKAGALPILCLLLKVKHNVPVITSINQITGQRRRANAEIKRPKLFSFVLFVDPGAIFNISWFQVKQISFIFGIRKMTFS